MITKGAKTLAASKLEKQEFLKNLTQSDLAAQLQISGITIERDSISRMENGTRFVTDYELMILSQILNVSVDWLLSKE